jgi:hypothetical protein
LRRSEEALTGWAIDPSLDFLCILSFIPACLAAGRLSGRKKRKYVAKGKGGKPREPQKQGGALMSLPHTYNISVFTTKSPKAKVGNPGRWRLAIRRYNPDGKQGIYFIL